MKRKLPLAGIKSARNALLLIASSGLLAWLAFRAFVPPQADLAVQQPSASQWGEGQGNPFGAGQAIPTARTAPVAVAREAQVDLTGTSLAGTQPDGQWAADAQGQLRKDFSLRQRLDYFLTLLGEKPLSELRALVRQKAQADLPEPALSQLMQLWDRYVQLQQHAFKTMVDLRQPSGWSAALLERQTVRRELLGADVAYAFYSHEERELQNMLARVNTGSSAPTEPSMPVAAVLTDAPQREAQLQAEWKAWDQRIETARAQVQRLQAAPELSAEQRQQAVQQVLLSQFQQGSERTRAASLLGL